jgi:hypothetical protein
MAYVDQNKKAKIAAALKLVMPKGWKYSLAVRNHSTIICTIASAPFDLFAAMTKSPARDPATITHADLNPYYIREAFTDECVADVFEAIMGALNTDNYDKSDLQSDYFDCGHYVSLKLGRWDKPFAVTSAEAVTA